MVNIQKAAVIGCGFVGSTIAYTLMQKGLFSEMVLLDANKAKAEGEAMDISHGLPFTHAMDIYAGEYEDIADASVVIITAGANQKPGETRLDLVQKNAAIMRSIIKEIKRVNCEGILLIVSNPVDILTEVALRESGFPKERVNPVLVRHLGPDSAQGAQGKEVVTRNASRATTGGSGRA